MNILPILKSNFVDICQSIIDGTLQGKAKFEKKATVVKYLVPKGYPTDPLSDVKVEIDEEKIKALGAKVYYAAVYRNQGQIYTTSSRAIGVVGTADTLSEAEIIAEKATQLIKGDLFHRTDIGTQEVLDRRIDHMKNVLK